jgi:hypothetical protein
VPGRAQERIPGGGGRELASDNTEFLRIRLLVSLISDKGDQPRRRLSSR